MIFRTLACGSSIVNNSKIDDFQVLMLAPFGFHFGNVLGAQMEADAIKKPPQKIMLKNDAPNEPKLAPKGVRNWSPNHQK